MQNAASSIFLISFALSSGAAAADEGLLTLSTVEALFGDAIIISGPELVDCTLSGGAETTCFQIEVKPEPTSYIPGPWCPSNLSDGPEASGIWLENGEVYDADGDFFANLATLYGDANWQMIDPETGEIKVTDSPESCAAAANPNVGPEYANFCVQCLPEYMADDASVTYTIPLEPVESDAPSGTNTSGSGIAFNGVRLDGPAPTDAILGAYTVAPFDDCGGHVNPNVGYHYHAVTDCLTEVDTGIDAPIIGVAMDGYYIASHYLSSGESASGLDSCNGHDEGPLGYHYHAGEAGSNAILGCVTAQVGCVSEEPGAVCDASDIRRGPPPRTD